jgi:hypothetical protein
MRSSGEHQPDLLVRMRDAFAELQRVLAELQGIGGGVTTT